jgi:hypothetical protein
MAVKPYTFRVREARSFKHPFFPTITKHTFLVRAADLPSGLPRGANARESVGTNRRVYRDVRESLRANEAWPGTFDLMNLGITILADEIKKIGDGEFQVMIDDEDGIVNGGHTAAIIEECQADETVHPDQHVEVRIVIGVNETSNPDLKRDIAKGQNTGIAVKDQSIFEKSGAFQPIKDVIRGEKWAETVAYRESDKGDIDVRDLVALLEALNVIDFPNDDSQHPIQAYEKPSEPLKRYAQDFEENRNHLHTRKYAALEPLLLDALHLYDRVRRDFHQTYNDTVAKGAGKLNIIEEANQRIKHFHFVHSGQTPHKYRLTKGAAFPIFAAFRNFVEYDPTTHQCSWIGGFDAVLDVWENAAPELVKETSHAIRDIGRNPDILGKSRPHWANMHRVVENRLLRMQLKAMKSGAA